MSHTLIKVFLFSSSQFTAQDGGQGSITSLAVRCSGVAAACSRRDLGSVTGAPPARAYNRPQPSLHHGRAAASRHTTSLATPSILDHGLVRGAGQCHVATSMFITMSRDVCCVSICPCLDAGLVSVPDLGTRGGGGWLQRGRSQPSAGFLPGPVFTRASNEGPHEGS